MNQVVAFGRGVLVRVTGASGAVGVGECSPLPGRSPDQLAYCASVLGSARAPGDIPAELPAARFALETALADLRAQAAGLAVAELITLDPMRELPCSAVVAAGGAAPHPDISTWKVKIGTRPVDHDIEALRARPAGVRLRLDVNRRWSPEQAARALPMLAELDPDWVEEPMTARALLTAGKLPVPIGLDESVRDDPAATRAALDRGLVRALVLKPAVLGGLEACVAWARHSRAAGAVPIISHLFDGPVAFAAYAELALALARPGDPAPGLGPHAGLRECGGVVPPQLDGARIVSHRPGLGVAG